MTYHVALVSSARDIDAASVESEDKGDGIRLRYGVRHGSQTREAFGYEFDADKYTSDTANAYMLGRGLQVLEFRAAKGAEPKYVEIEYEIARTGTWRPNVYDAKGNPVDTDVEFTAEMFRDMVETLAADSAVNKLGHNDDQSGARELFENSDRPMGVIQSLRVDGEALIAKARVPVSVKQAIDARLLLQRSIEAAKRGGRWVLTAVAWLKNTPPAVQGMPDAQVSASIFASARLVLAETDPAPEAPAVEDGEDKTTAGTVPEVTEPDPTQGKEENDMSEELKAQNEQLLASYRTLAGRQIDDLVGKKITPAQGEAAKKLIASMSDTASIDAQIEYIRAAQDLPKQVAQGDGRTPKEETVSELDRLAKVEQQIAAAERSPAHRVQLSDSEARLQASARQLMAQNPKLDFGDALMEAARRLPKDVDTYLEATGRLTVEEV